jgi:hypothetical protein
MLVTPSTWMCLIMTPGSAGEGRAKKKKNLFFGGGGGWRGSKVVLQHVHPHCISLGTASARIGAKGLATSRWGGRVRMRASMSDLLSSSNTPVTEINAVESWQLHISKMHRPTSSTVLSPTQRASLVAGNAIADSFLHHICSTRDRSNDRRFCCVRPNTSYGDIEDTGGV